MTRHLHTVLKAIGAVAVLGIVGNSVSLAATGQGFILGKSNTANKVTTLQRTSNGPVLNLRNRNRGAAPFTVNGQGRVVNLNADRLDGLHANAFARNATLNQLRGEVTQAKSTADQANAAAGQAGTKADQAAAAAATADGKATFATQNSVDAMSLANEAHVLGLNATNGVGKLEAREPVAQAVIDEGGATPVFPSRGVTSVTRPVAGVYNITLQSGTFNAANHVVQVTPVGRICVPLTTAGTGAQAGTLRVEFYDVDGNAVNCSFHLTVTKL